MTMIVGTLKIQETINFLLRTTELMFQDNLKLCNIGRDTTSKKAGKFGRTEL